MHDLKVAQRAALIKNLGHWLRLEDRDSRFFMDMSLETRDDFVKSLYTNIANDSLRHFAMIHLTIDLLNRSGSPIARVPASHLRRIRRHIVLERKASRYAEGVVKKFPAGYVRLLLEQILTDEKQHHKILSQMIRDSQKLQGLLDSITLNVRSGPDVINLAIPTRRK